MGKKAIHKQEPWKRKILIDATEICDILEHAIVSSLSCICFIPLPPEEMELPRHLRLLDWEGYPSKSLPPTFHPEYLVKLHMQDSKLEKLWDGIQPLTSLKKIDLSWSLHLKELADLSKATNLELLDLSYCQSLVELPSSFSNLHKLKRLCMSNCLKLEVIPTNWNLASLEYVIVSGCPRLPNFPCISMSTNMFTLSDTAVRDVPASIKLWSHLKDLEISGHGMLKTLPRLPTNITMISLSDNGLESISNCCIEDLRMLRELTLSGCRKLTSLPELPYSLEVLDASDCESLETVCFPFNLPEAELIFNNCFKLDQQARRAIIQDSFFLGVALLPGREVPAEFDHRAMGTTLTFPLPAFSSFKVCLVLSPNQLTGVYDFPEILCRRIRKGYLYPVEKVLCYQFNTCQRKHLFIFHSEWLYEYRWLKVSSDIMFEFSSTYQDFDIIECGAQILTHDEEET